MAEEERKSNLLDTSKEQEPRLSIGPNRPNDEENKDEPIEGLGLDLGEEQLGMVKPKEEEKDLLYKQKTHSKLTDTQLEDLIGMRKRGQALDILYPKKETVSISCFGNLRVSLFWEEKLLLFLHAFQLLGYYFVVFYEQVPTAWKNLANFFAFFVLKFDTIGFYEKSISNYSAIFLNAIIWAGAAIGIFIALIILMNKGVLQKLVIADYNTILKIIYYSLELLVFPFLLNTVPQGACQFVTRLPDLKPYACWSEPLHLIVVIAAGCVIAIVCLIAFAVRAVASSNYVYDMDHDHEAYLRTKELEYVFDLSYVWRTSYYFLFASFRREGFTLYHRFIWYLFILVLVGLYSGLVPSASSFIGHGHRHALLPDCHRRHRVLVLHHHQAALSLQHHQHPVHRMPA